MTLSDLIPGVPQAKLVLAGIMLALFAVPTVGLLITRHTLASVKLERDAFHAQRDAEIAKNTVNLRSIADLQSALADKNAESERRAKALTDAQAEDQRNRAAFDKQQVATDGKIKALEAIARAPGGNADCRAPKAVTDALEGL